MSEHKPPRRRRTATWVTVTVLATAGGYVVGVVAQPAHPQMQGKERADADSLVSDTTLIDSGWSEDAWWRRPFDSLSWDPFSQMRQMQRQMDRLFDDAWNPRGGPSFFDELGAGFGAAPDVQLQEEGDKFIVRVDMHGIDQSAIEIEVADDVLTLHGQREEQVEERDADGNITRQSSSTSEFSRALSLPEPVAADKMESRYEDSVLVIELPKAEEK